MVKSRKMARSRTKKLRKKNKRGGGDGSDEINRPYTTIYDINGKPVILKREEAVAEEKAKKVVLAVEGDVGKETEEKNFSVDFVDKICGPDEDYSHIEVKSSFPFNLNRENIYYNFRGKNIHEALGDKGKKICPKLKPYLTNRGYCCSETPPPLSPDEEEPDPTPEYEKYKAPARAPRETLEEIRDLHNYAITRSERIPKDNLIQLSPSEISKFWYDEEEDEEDEDAF